MEFSPSEVEDLETIDLPRTEQPKWYWNIEELEQKPHFPGQLGDPKAWADEKRRLYPDLYPQENSHPPVRENRPSLFGPLEPTQEEEREGAFVEECERESQDLEENLPEPEEGSPRPPRQEPGRRRKPKPRLQTGSAQDGDQPPPPLRRSARISAMKRKAESLPSQQTAEAPNKKRKLRAPSNEQATAPAPIPEPITRAARRGRAAKPVPARPPPPAKTETHTRAKRGRVTARESTKGDIRSSRSAVTKKKQVKKKPDKAPASVEAPPRRSKRTRSSK